MSFALGQPQGCTGASLGCPKARDNLGSLLPSTEKTTCSFPYRSLGNYRNAGLVPGNRGPKEKPKNSREILWCWPAVRKSVCSLRSSDLGKSKWGLSNGGGHSLQFAHNRLQLCTFVALLGPFFRRTFVGKWRRL